MYCKGDYQLRNGIAHEDQAQWPCSPGLLAVQNGNPEAVEEDDGEGGRSILERLRKWICLGRERHMEVGFSEILLQGVFFFYNFTHFRIQQDIIYTFSKYFIPHPSLLQ